MRIPDEKLAEVFDRGFTVVEGFLDKATLSDAQDALWEIYPRPEAYFADPAAYSKFARSQFAGLRFFPYPSWALNKVPVYPDLIDAAERFLQTKEVDCYKIELWAKYAGAIDYDQTHHRDYENHTIVVPRADQLMPQMTCFILLSDVTEPAGPVIATSSSAKSPTLVWAMPKGMSRVFASGTALVGPSSSVTSESRMKQVICGMSWSARGTTMVWFS